MSYLVNPYMVTASIQEILLVWEELGRTTLGSSAGDSISCNWHGYQINHIIMFVMTSSYSRSNQR